MAQKKEEVCKMNALEEAKKMWTMQKRWNEEIELEILWDVESAGGKECRERKY